MTKDTKDFGSIEDLLNKTEASTESVAGQFKKKLGEINLKDLEEETRKQAAGLGLSYINLVGFPITPDSLILIEELEAKQLQTVCFYYDQDKLRLASTQPQEPATQAKLQELKETYYQPNAEILLCSPHSLDYALQLYHNLPKIKSAKPGVEIKGEDLARWRNTLANASQLRQQINQVNITEVITLMIASALNLESTDIHVEAEEKNLIVRLRVDGILQDMAEINKQRWPQIVARLKVLAKVKLNINDKPQDGRFTIWLASPQPTSEDGPNNNPPSPPANGYGEMKIDVRASFLPTAYGESVVLRLLLSNVTGLDLAALGLRPQALTLINQEIKKPNGLILSVGPTGSGKTTTLYAILKQLNQPGSKIITVEDPIEYSLAGVNQSQIDESKNYGFAKALKSILRQDPDIIMVGEIRDLETAEIAVQSSLTGHLVLSTLHTNDAAGVIPRLLDLGIKPFLLTPSLNVIIGQRLVRKLCANCRQPIKLSEADQETLKKILATISPKIGLDIPVQLPTLYGPGNNQACSHCHGIGYKGRNGIFEVLQMTNRLKEAADQGLSAFKILEIAIEEGMLTMLQDGVLQAMDGLTSLDEVYRAIGKMEYVDTLYDIVTSRTIGRGLKINQAQMQIGQAMAKDFLHCSALLTGQPVNEIINVLLAAAIQVGASDVHLDPTEQGATLRFRLDGLLHDLADLMPEHYVPLLNTIKQLAAFPTDIKQVTYDGRFAIYLPARAGLKNKQRLNCRVSIISGGHGEAAVLRLLAANPQTLKMDELGIRFKTLDVITEVITKNSGIIINAGPTGSGKTTTLYALLNQLNRADNKIITIEDPIEYTLPGVMQTQVESKSDYTFSTALRSLLRQNPNIIMIGEIRDQETAKTAMEAALTGHLVLSTVHASSAAGAMLRLIELGIDKNTLASALTCSIGQRLVRRLCPNCKQVAELPAETLKIVQEILGRLDQSAQVTLPPKLTFYAAPGCEQCGELGYKGRLGLYEAISADATIKALISQPQLLDQEIEAAAYKTGFISVLQDGILKCLAGDTSVEEVLRVAK